MTMSLMSVAQFQAPGVGGDAQHALHRRIVDEQLGVAQHAAGVDEAVHVVGTERALAETMAVDARLGAQETLGQLDPRLLQADEEDGLFFINDDISDNSERKSSVVNADVIGDKIVRLWDGQIVNLFNAH